MKDFLHQYCAKNEKKINPAVFERTYDKPLKDFIINICKNLEVLPPITLDSWEYITDQSKIKLVVNKRLNKDVKIKNNKALERINPINDSLTDLLVLNFTINLRGTIIHMTSRMLVFKELPGHTFIMNKKKVTTLNQVVDNSTFVKDNSLKFKTTLFPLELYTAKEHLTFTNGDKYTGKTFRMNLFSKIANPLLYYLAKYGVDETISLFNLDSVMSVVTNEIDKTNYLYVHVKNNVYIEINKKAIRAHDFVLPFVTTMYDAMTGDSDMKYADTCRIDYWLERLSEIFSKRSVDKGRKVLISFSKIMDPTTTKRLSLNKRHKKNTHTIVRWLLVNYDELLKKDNHDLKYKRVRANECIAYCFDKYITNNINSLLNDDKASIERYCKLIGSINEFTLFKAIHSSKTDPYSLFRYESYNDFNAINIARYTLKGPAGLNMGKNKTPVHYRDIYESQVGRYDLNVCSSSDPGLTGYLTCNVKVDENGHFDENNSEPDVYDSVIDNIMDKIAEDTYATKRLALMRLEKYRDNNGFVKLTRKMTNADVNKELAANPYKHGLFPTADGFIFIKKYGSRTPKGYINMKKTASAEVRTNERYTHDEYGYIIMKTRRKVNLV